MRFPENILAFDTYCENLADSHNIEKGIPHINNTKSQIHLIIVFFDDA